MVADVKIHPPLLHRDFERTRRASGNPAAIAYLSAQIGTALKLAIFDSDGVSRLRANLSGGFSIVDDRLHVPIPETAVEQLEALNLSDGLSKLRVGKADHSMYVEVPIGLLSTPDRRMTSSVNLNPTYTLDLAQIVFAFTPPPGSGGGGDPIVDPPTDEGFQLTDPEYERLWGPGLTNGSALADINVGRTQGVDKIVIQRFRATASGQVAEVAGYLTGVGPPYASGTGGTMRVRIYPVTSEGLPDFSVTPIASGQRFLNLNAGVFRQGNWAYEPIPITSGTRQVVRGTRYVAVWDNVDPDPSVNWCGVNSTVTSLANPRGNIWARPGDMSVLFGHKTPAAQTYQIDDFTLVGNSGLRYSPIYMIRLDDGKVMGTGPVFLGELITGTDRNYTPTDAIRLRITPTATRGITAFTLNASASVAGNLQWFLMKDGAVIEGGSINQPTANYTTHMITGENYARHSNYTVPLSAKRTLEQGQTYDLAFIRTDPAVWKFSADIHAHTWGSPASPNEFVAEIYNGSAWVLTDPGNHANPNPNTRWRVTFHTAPPDVRPPDPPADNLLSVDRLVQLMTTQNEARMWGVQAGNQDGWNDLDSIGFVQIGAIFRHSALASQTWYGARFDNQLCDSVTSWFVFGEAGTGPQGQTPGTLLNAEGNAAVFVRLVHPAYALVRPGYSNVNNWEQLTYNSGQIHCDRANKVNLETIGSGPETQNLGNGVWKFRVNLADPYVMHGAAIRTTAPPSGNYWAQDVRDIVRGSAGPGLPGIDYYSRIAAIVTEVWEVWVGPWDPNQPFDASQCRMVGQIGMDPYLNFNFTPGYWAGIGATSLRNLTETPQLFALATLMEADNHMNGYSSEAGITVAQLRANLPPSLRQ